MSHFITDPETTPGSGAGREVRPIREARPLSFAQERLWFLESLTPGSTAYNATTGWRLSGTLALTALERALAEIVRRHDVLRTTFHERDGALTQAIAPAMALDLRIDDMSGSAQADPSQAIEDWCRTEAARAFDLAAGPLFRARLLRQTPQAHVLLLSMHHIVTDGWSWGVLFKELSALYAAYCERGEAALPPLKHQYAAHAARQRRSVDDPAHEAHLAYWRRQLAEMPARLTIPGDRPRPAAQTFRGAQVRCAFPPALLDQLRALGRRHGATLYMVLLATFNVLLSKYSGSDDIVVGSPVAGRVRREDEDLIGLFLNTLVLRTDLSGNPIFTELLRRVRDVTLDASEHQAVPFEQLVSELRPERALDHSPLFQVMFGVGVHALFGASHSKIAALELPGLAVERLPVTVETTKCDLAVSVVAQPRQFDAVLTYSTDLFASATIQRLLRHWQVLVARVVADPTLRLAHLSLCDAEEREAVLAWSNRPGPAVTPQLVHDRFKQQAARTPDALAVSGGAAALTYRQLNGCAASLARHLRRLNVGPEVRVGIYLSRTPQMVAAVLGVLKAGGAYVPLDPTYPAARLEYMLHDAGARVVIVQNRRDVRFRIPSDISIVAIDEALSTSVDGGDEPGLSAANLAYVLYTSGSSGTPKGVAVDHAAFSAYLSWAEATYPGQSSAVHSSLSFDLTATSLFVPLLRGGHVQLIDEADPVRGLAEDLERGRPMELLKLTPTHLRALGELLDERSPVTMPRCLVVGGEALLGEQLSFWRRHFPETSLVNEYGPTETVVGCCVEIQPLGGVGDGAVPIGQPAPNCQIYVLDSAGEIAPCGVAGELVVGGSQIARGYLGRPASTAARFVPDPFGALPGARLYRTGDRGRWTAEAKLEFLGRLDDQVKIRGFRIEPGEVEQVIRRQPDVTDCVVVARESGGVVRLVAYVAGHIDVDDLRARIQQQLPPQMLPSAIVRLDRLPVTPNGKVDRNALPMPATPTDGVAYVSPRSDVERLLAEIWAEILRLPRVGVTQNFFAIGGDSIVAIQVVSRMRRAGLAIVPRQMFEYQTIAELAAIVSPAAAIPAPDATTDGAGPLSPIQAWFFEQRHPSPSHHNQSVVFELADDVPDSVLEPALKVVFAHHEALRLRFVTDGGAWRQSCDDRSSLTLERVDLSDLSGADRERAQTRIATERQASLCLERGPVGAAVLFDRGDGRQLLLVLHHLVVDGVSWRILREDLEQASRQIAGGSDPVIDLPHTSFREWSAALSRLASGDDMRREASWWLSQTAAELPSLPVDGEDERTVATASALTVALSAAETTALLHAAPAAYRAQITELLLYALGETIEAWTGRSRVRITLEGHGREEAILPGADLTRTVGWFTTRYPLLLDLSGSAGVAARVKRIKAQLRAIPRRGIGYGILRYYSPDAAIRQALASPGEPEISFNYRGQRDAGAANDAWLRPVDGSRGCEWAATNRRASIISLQSTIDDGRLQLTWTYHAQVHHPATIERVAAWYLEALRALLASANLEGESACVPSDFPLVTLTQDELDRLLAGTRTVEDLLPLSPLQEGMVFHALHDLPDQPYLVQVARRLQGRLDLARFQSAWSEIFDRHAILRAALVWDDAQRPLLRIDASVPLPWLVGDWQARSEDERHAALTEYLAEDRRRRFDLTQAPLMRCALFRAGVDSHWLVCTYHHLILDGWSLSRVLNDVLRVYEQRSGGAAPVLASRRPYRDYVKWLRAQDQAAAKAYWSEALRGLTAPTPFGVDRPAASRDEPRHAKLSLALSAERTRELERAARRMRVTVNSALLGAWAILLGRYGGTDDVLFGALVSARPAELAGVEEMIGLFVNTLPVRVRIPSAMPLDMWLRELQQSQAESRQYDYASLADIQRCSDAQAGTPLFESLFTFENFPVDRLDSGISQRLTVAARRSAEWSTYPLSLVAVPGDALSLHLSYDETRFERKTVAQMLRHLSRVLDQMATAPNGRLSDVTVLEPAEREALTIAWNATERSWPRTATLVSQFAAQVAAHPTAVAVEWGATKLTYAALDARANALAQRLRAAAVGPETRVGILLPRGPDLVTAIIGIIKAGGAYVPLDLQDPPARQAWVVADAGISVLVAGSTATTVADVRLVTVPDAGCPVAPPVPLQPANLAYIVYTSGSTGRPKGVMVAHREVLQLVCGTDYVELGPGDRIAQASHASFDALTFEVWGALLNGATLVGVPPEVATAPAALASHLRAARITTLYQTTALLNMLARETPDVFASLREVLFGGQAAHAASVRRLLTAGGPQRLLHMYGPTETTAWCSWAAVSAVAAEARTVSVGQPTGNARIYLLDPWQHLVPVGVPGEAHVGGAGIVRGYLGRPGLTAARFVPDPFGPPGSRLYRTGDLLRRGADGALEFVGRLDAQVKIRGFRIEPGEVEAVLGREPGVREARVVVREDMPGEPQLVAYVVGAVSPAEVRDALGRQLPPYLVPAAVVSLDRLPLTATGKLDVASLPAPTFGDPKRAVAPSTPLEEALVGIWSAVLRLPHLGVNENFFALGGHSLLATRVVSYVREIFGISLSPRLVFDAPSVAEFAAKLASDPRHAECVARVEDTVRQWRHASSPLGV